MTGLLCCLALFGAAPANPAEPLPPGARLRIGTARLRHGDVIRALAFSPDGKLLASASHDQTVSVWEIPSGRERLRLPGHAADVLSVSFSADGKLLASGGADGTVRLWEVRPGGGQVHAFALKAGVVEAVAFAPGGKVLAAGGDDGHIWLLDVPGRTSLRRLAQDRGVRCLAWSSDGKLLAASGGTRSGVNVYDVAAGKLLGSFGDEAAQALAFAPGARRLVSWEPNGPLRLWDAERSKQLGQATPDRLTARGADAVVYQVAFSDDGRALFAGSVSGTVDVYDADLKRLRQLSGHHGRVTALAVSRGVVASGGADGTIRLWDARTGKALTAEAAVAAPVAALAVAPRGKALAAVLSSGEVRLFDRTTGRPLPKQVSRPARSAALSGDGRSLALVVGASLVLWDVRAGRLAPAEMGDPPFAGVAFSGDGKALVTVQTDGTVTVRDPSGKRRRDLAGKERGVSLAVTADGQGVAGVGKAATITLWDAATGKPRRPLSGHRGGTLAAAFSADGRLLVSGGRDRMLRLWDLTTGRERRAAAGHTDWVSAVAISPDGRLIASGTARGTIRVWSARTGQRLRELEGHRGAVTGLTFADGSATLISASRDTTVLVWDTDKLDEKPKE